MPRPIQILVVFLALFTIGMLLMLWRFHYDSEAVGIINTVAAIVSVPVSGLVAIALWLRQPTLT